MFNFGVLVIYTSSCVSPLDVLFVATVGLFSIVLCNHIELCLMGQQFTLNVLFERKLWSY